MPDLETTEKTARRLLELAALLAIVASVLLIIDYMLKQQILKAAEEVTRAIESRGHHTDDRPAARPGRAGLDDVVHAEPRDEGTAEAAELRESV